MAARRRIIVEVASIILLFLILVAVWGLGYWTRGIVEAGDWVAQGEYPPPISVDVREGENFWVIAREFYDKTKYNTVDVVRVIERMNPHLDPKRLSVGDRVFLPRYEEL